MKSYNPETQLYDKPEFPDTYITTRETQNNNNNASVSASANTVSNKINSILPKLATAPLNTQEVIKKGKLFTYFMIATILIVTFPQILGAKRRVTR